MREHRTGGECQRRWARARQAQGLEWSDRGLGALVTTSYGNLEAGENLVWDEKTGTLCRGNAMCDIEHTEGSYKPKAPFAPRGRRTHRRVGILKSKEP